MKIDPDKLTLGELIDIEEKAGVGINEVFEKLPTRGLAALAWVVRRRDEPSFSWDDVLKMDFHAVDATFEKAAQNGLGFDEEVEAVDPTEPPADESTST